MIIICSHNECYTWIYIIYSSNTWLVFLISQDITICVGLFCKGYRFYIYRFFSSLKTYLYSPGLSFPSTSSSGSPDPDPSPDPSPDASPDASTITASAGNNSSQCSVHNNHFSIIKKQKHKYCYTRNSAVQEIVFVYIIVFQIM